jgi:hypothetical protein
LVDEFRHLAKLLDFLALGQKDTPASAYSLKFTRVEVVGFWRVAIANRGVEASTSMDEVIG